MMRLITLLLATLVAFHHRAFADLPPKSEAEALLTQALPTLLDSNFLGTLGLQRSQGASPTPANVSNTTQCPSGSGSYTLVPGDICSSLASSANTDVSTLQQINPSLDCPEPTAGAAICIPISETQTACNKTHIVLPGDYCERLAGIYDLTGEEFADLNPGIDCSAVQTFNTICVGDEFLGPLEVPDEYNVSEPNDQILFNPVQHVTSGTVLTDLQAASVNSRQIDLLYAAFVHNHGGNIPGTYAGDTTDRRQVFNETVTNLTVILQNFALYEQQTPVVNPPPFNLTQAAGDNATLANPIIVADSPPNNQTNPPPQFGFTVFSTYTSAERQALLGAVNDSMSLLAPPSSENSVQAAGSALGPYELAFPYSGRQYENYVSWYSHIASDGNFYPYVTTVKDQGQCGSCWDFAAVAVLESIRLIKTGSCPDLSEQQILDCLVRQENNFANTCFGFNTSAPGPHHLGGLCAPNVQEGDTCSGGQSNHVLRYACQYGVGPNTTYPYPQDFSKPSPQDSGVCRVNPGTFRYQPPHYTRVPLSVGRADYLATNVMTLMRAVTQQPVTMYLSASGLPGTGDEKFFITGGMVYADMCNTQKIDHAVAIIGYNVGDLDSSGQPLRTNGYWIVRNQWGADWGVYPEASQIKGPRLPIPASRPKGYFYIDMWGEKRTPAAASGYVPESGPCGIYQFSWFADARV